MKAWMLTCLVLGSIGVAGCGGENASVPVRAANISRVVGVVEEIRDRDEPIPGEANPVALRNREYLLVAGTPTTLVTVDNETEVYVRSNGEETRVDGLIHPRSQPYSEGDRVEATLENFVGWVQPPQGRASKLVIIR